MQLLGGGEGGILLAVRPRHSWVIIRWLRSFVAPVGQPDSSSNTLQKCLHLLLFLQKPSAVEMNQMHTSSYNPGTVLIKAKTWPRISLPKKVPTEKVNAGQLFCLHQERLAGPSQPSAPQAVAPLGSGIQSLLEGPKSLCVLLHCRFALWSLLRG